SYDKMCIYLNLMILIKIIRGFISAECEDFVFSHRVKAFICLDDDESLFPVGYPHLQKTNYYTGLTESDLAALNTRYHLLMKRWAS
ncbi:hypothetical protein LAX53_24410, partial [Escherichia coli]|nr:hypothetical protein [Escherichia coli]